MPEVECGAEKTIQHPDFDEDYITQTHVCGMITPHRTHICRKADCTFTWEDDADTAA